MEPRWVADGAQPEPDQEQAAIGVTEALLAEGVRFTHKATLIDSVGAMG